MDPERCGVRRRREGTPVGSSTTLAGVGMAVRQGRVHAHRILATYIAAGYRLGLLVS